MTGPNPAAALKIGSTSVDENIRFGTPGNLILVYLIHLILMISNDIKAEYIIQQWGPSLRKRMQKYK